ncbi:glutathionylspermidine synthase family protein [Rathayibacter rathayi]|uniref:glutathionylspermidine synthase family protein n=1 Tax=Rathayibacter rathayi TaxID=33887 RepID=UPI001C670180|nr:glutathionylspermidine synthase family protein [Rathayibacter rathayi]
MEVGFSFYDLPAEGGRPYWNESAAYSFTPAEVDLLERATSELFDLCMAACERVVRHGRFYLAYDNAGTVKLLEFNADTPTSLVETAAAQRQWLLETQGPDADQFNSLHEQLIQQWRGFGSSGKSGFGSTVGG